MSKPTTPPQDRAVLDRCFSNMFSNEKYAPDYLFYAHMIGMCSVVMEEMDGPAGVSFHIDHYKLHIDTNKFGEFSLEGQLAVIKHEMLHILNGHIGRREDRDPLKFNYATDCAINQMINPQHLPEGGVLPSNLPVKPGSKCVEGLSAEHYYNMLDLPDQDEDQDCDSCDGSGEGDDGEECEDCGGSGKKPSDGQPGEGKGQGAPGNMDSHDKWDESEGDADLQKDITKNMIEKSVSQTQKSRGNVPSQISDYLAIFSRKREVDWKKILRGVTGNKKVNTRRTIMRVDRRSPGREDLRGKTKDRMFNLLLVLDVSGSMSNDAIVSTLGEVAHICDITKSELDIIQIDTKAYPPEKFNKSKKDFTRKAAGGTTLAPALEMAKEHGLNYNAVVVLTDGGLCESDVDAFRATKKKTIWLIDPTGYKMDSMDSGLMQCHKLKAQ